MRRRTVGKSFFLIGKMVWRPWRMDGGGSLKRELGKEEIKPMSRRKKDHRFALAKVPTGQIKEIGAVLLRYWVGTENAESGGTPGKRAVLTESWGCRWSKGGGKGHLIQSDRKKTTFPIRSP